MCGWTQAPGTSQEQRNILVPAHGAIIYSYMPTVKGSYVHLQGGWGQPLTQQPMKEGKFFQKLGNVRGPVPHHGTSHQRPPIYWFETVLVDGAHALAIMRPTSHNIRRRWSWALKGPNPQPEAPQVKVKNGPPSWERKSLLEGRRIGEREQSLCSRGNQVLAGQNTNRSLCPFWRTLRRVGKFRGRWEKHKEGSGASRVPVDCSPEDWGCPSGRTREDSGLCPWRSTPALPKYVPVLQPWKTSPKCQPPCYYFQGIDVLLALPWGPRPLCHVALPGHAPAHRGCICVHNLPPTREGTKRNPQREIQPVSPMGQGLEALRHDTKPPVSVCRQCGVQMQAI
ncbi:hypothetical protein CRENBAI_013559 [Crenichthys baileyi]|uniref:Uncharacterized protein n=1 Tax=Crenichthys baileyi TaxID=28760 RepID=A0AAV9RLJ2_9TELE